ncbi:MAG: hypothetical protein P4M07_06135 [Xanthobacteraceae bacterium]|nr:hypothetical protein [Xanthobacteraceae bacterium]
MALLENSMGSFPGALRLGLTGTVLGLVLVAIAVDCAMAQAPQEPPDVTALPGNREEPPSIDPLFESRRQSEAAKQSLANGQTSFHINPCAGGERTCDDQLGQIGRDLYTRLRKCWQPKPGTAVATAFWFGEETAAERHAAPARGDISIRFQLTRDGHVAGSPWSTALATSDALSAEVIDALRRCQPYEVPSDRFETWRDALMRIQIRAAGDKTAFHKF